MCSIGSTLLSSPLSSSFTPLKTYDLFLKLFSSSYRPISNLDFISEILERLFLSRIQSSHPLSPNFNQYHCNHSIEPSFLHTLNNILLSCTTGLIFSVRIGGAALQLLPRLSGFSFRTASFYLVHFFHCSHCWQ